MRRSRHVLELVILIAVVAVSVAVYRSSQPPPEDELLELGEGIRLYKAHQYARSLPFFNEVLRRQPDSIQAYAYRGKSEFALKRYDAARADYDAGLMRAEPVFVQLLYPRLTVQLLTERARLEAATGQYEQAIKDATTAMDRAEARAIMPFDHTVTEAQGVRAIAHAGLKHYTDASTDLYMSSLFAGASQTRLLQRHLAALEIMQGNELSEAMPYYQTSEGAQDDDCLMCAALRPHEAELKKQLELGDNKN